MTRKITVEEINGQMMTVIWHNGKPKGLLDRDTDEFLCRSGSLEFGRLHTHIATALPPLPRHPKTDDAPLLYRYMAEGIMLRGKCFDIFGETEDDVLIVPQMDSEITHAIDSETGERVDVAIKESE